jgi:hypothetical protein
MMTSGVPVGAQTAWLSCKSTGKPFDVILKALVTHCAVTQGPLPLGGGGKGQPATAYGAAFITMGWPLTVTRGLVTVG